MCENFPKTVDAYLDFLFEKSFKDFLIPAANEGDS